MKNIKCILLLFIAFVSVNPTFLYSLETQLFSPALDSLGLLTLESSNPLPQGEFSLGVNFGISGKNFNYSKETGVDDAISYLMTGNILIGAGVLERVELGVNLPFSFVKGDGISGYTTETENDKKLSARGLGDMKFIFKGTILEDKEGQIGIGLLPYISLATGDENAFLGAGNTNLGATLILDKTFRNFKTVINVGYKYRFPERIYEDVSLKLSSEISYGLGFDYKFIIDNDYFNSVDLIFEVFGKSFNNNYDIQDEIDKANEEIDKKNEENKEEGNSQEISHLPDNPFESLKNEGWEYPLEIDLAIRFVTQSPFVITVGGGRGITKGLGSPNYRGFANIRINTW